jgi:hypothetical protein
LEIHTIQNLAQVFDGEQLPTLDLTTIMLVASKPAPE